MPSAAEHLVAPLAGAEALDAPVRAVMRAGVISVPEDASILQVQRALVGHGVHAVLVLATGTGDIVGWATTRGVLERTLADASLLPAALAVTEPVEVISPNASVEEALRKLVETGASRLLVRRGPCTPAEGVLSDVDLVRLITPA
jgi:CBS domain-containing protein